MGTEAKAGVGMEGWDGELGGGSQYLIYSLVARGHDGPDPGSNSGSATSSPWGLQASCFISLSLSFLIYKMETVIPFSEGFCSLLFPWCPLETWKSSVTCKVLLTKVRLVKAMVFPVVMYGCDSWTVKKAERRRMDAFELWCWRKLLRVPGTARRSYQSILKEINPEYSLEGLMLKLKLQYFGPLMWRANSLEKTLMLGKIEGRRGQQRRDGWMASPTLWTWVWVNSGI